MYPTHLMTPREKDLPIRPPTPVLQLVLPLRRRMACHRNIRPQKLHRGPLIHPSKMALENRLRKPSNISHMDSPVHCHHFSKVIVANAVAEDMFYSFVQPASYRQNVLCTAQPGQHSEEANHRIVFCDRRRHAQAHSTREFWYVPVMFIQQTDSDTA
jgi:hypothetical protein